MVESAELGNAFKPIFQIFGKKFAHRDRRERLVIFSFFAFQKLTTFQKLKILALMERLGSKKPILGVLDFFFF